MRTTAPLVRYLSILATTVALLAFPIAASAADPASVTITSCTSDAVTLAGKVALTGSSARKARGAVLQMRFQALALFGFPHAGQWKTIGKKTRASGQEAFTGLSADHWIGFLEFRYKKRSRTVVSGSARSQALRIGRRGQAGCTIAKGLKPVDSTPPKLFVVPADDLWHRAPAAVQLTATDDFSGVKSVSYSLDGGPQTAVPNGGSFQIAAEGAHSVAAQATDVAGNSTPQTVTVKVDAAPPSKPAVQSPPSVTANRAPTISWTPSTDSGSGMHGYVVTITRADGSTAATLTANADQTSVQAPTLDDNQTYTATVTAVDNTAGQPWATNSDPYSFRVDSNAEVTSITPAAGTVLSGSAKDTNFTLTLDRPADPSTVASSVKLTRNPAESGSSPSATVGCANNPCTQITIDPSGTLPEGRYTVTVDGLKSAGEGTPFQAFSAPYSVAFYEHPATITTGGTSCVLGNATSTQIATLNSSTADETGTLDFDWAFGAGTGWTVMASTSATPVSGGPGSGHAQLQYPIPHGTTSITFTFTSTCSGNPGETAGKLDVSNLVGARTP